MTKIIPERLKQLRKKRGLRQEELAEKSRVDKQTISRLERGEVINPRKHTIESLARALHIDAKELAEEDSGPSELDQLDNAQQINFRLSGKVRNALFMVSRGYKVSEKLIIELAPLLFLWAAKESLRRRMERLEKLKESQNVAYDLYSGAPHLFPGADGMDVGLRKERKSIEKRDLFARIFDDDEANSTASRGYWDEESEKNPFAQFLKELIEPFENIAEVESCDNYASNYIVMPKIAGEWFFGGDKELGLAADHGDFDLRKMPKGTVKERTEWARLALEVRKNELSANPTHQILEKLLDPIVKEINANNGEKP